MTRINWLHQDGKPRGKEWWVYLSNTYICCWLFISILAWKMRYFPCANLSKQLTFKTREEKLNRYPNVIGVEVVKGISILGTPLCFLNINHNISFGKVAGIQHKDTRIASANKNARLAIDIDYTPSGQEFNLNDELYSASLSTLWKIISAMN